MTIALNHTFVPPRDKISSAMFFVRIFGLFFNEHTVKYFPPVKVNETLTLDFHDDVDLSSRKNKHINHRGGGRGVYFCDLNRHILELLTVG